MNRNIKFRIYDDVHKIMVFIDEVFKMCFDDKHFESYELMFDENKCLICRGFDTIDSDFGDEMINDTYFNLQQYTGLKDINNVEIYEGDIIKCHYANAIKDTHIEQVIFYKGKFMAYEKIDGTEHLTSLYDGTSRLIVDKSVYMDKIEVIGNIYENKELLEEEG